MVSMQRGDAIGNESDDAIKEKHSECSHKKHPICEDDDQYNKVHRMNNTPFFVQTSNIHFTSIIEFLQIRESISLPCTLRKCKGSDSCRGSNNCYVWAMDFEQLSKRMDKLEKGCPKSKTLCADAKDSDNECLLTERTYGSKDDISSPEHQSTSRDNKAANVESSSLRSPSVCGTATSQLEVP